MGDGVIIQGKKNRNMWKLGIVTELIKGRDGITRAAKKELVLATLNVPFNTCVPWNCPAIGNNHLNLTQMHPRFIQD